MWGPCINFCILADTLASVLSRWALRVAPRAHRHRAACPCASRRLGLAVYAYLASGDLASGFWAE